MSSEKLKCDIYYQIYAEKHLKVFLYIYTYFWSLAFSGEQWKTGKIRDALLFMEGELTAVKAKGSIQGLLLVAEFKHLKWTIQLFY